MLDSRFSIGRLAPSAALAAIERPVDFRVQTVDLAAAGQCDELDLLGVAGLEAHGRTGGNVEPKATRRRAVELKGFVGLKEMIVRADLNGPIARVRDD